MIDYTFITSRLATGAAITTEKDVRVLVKHGVTHIIDCRAEFNDQSLIKGFNEADLGPTHPALKSHAKLQYLYNGVPDDGQPKPAAWFGKSILFALDALSHRHTKVFAHCAAGVNRGPSTTFAILLAFGFDPIAAEGFIRQRRPQVGLPIRMMPLWQSTNSVIPEPSL